MAAATPITASIVSAGFSVIVVVTVVVISVLDGSIAVVAVDEHPKPHVVGQEHEQDILEHVLPIALIYNVGLISWLWLWLWLA